MLDFCVVKHWRKDCKERDEIGVEEEEKEGKTAGNRNKGYMRLLSEVVSPKVFDGFGCSTLNQPHCLVRIALPTTPATILWSCSIPALQIHINSPETGLECWDGGFRNTVVKALHQALTELNKPVLNHTEKGALDIFFITMKKLVWEAMLRFMLSWLIMHTGDMILGSYACLANGTTRSFLCLGSKVHQMPCQIPSNTTYV